MAFSKKTWKDRVSQYINRRLLTDSDGNTQQVTVTRDEGSVTEAGDAFSAANMNDLENRIEAAIPVKIQDLDNVSLTTSDNNKLLGVSVSGSDISVGAVGVETLINDVNGITVTRQGSLYCVCLRNATVANAITTLTTYATNAYFRAVLWNYTKTNVAVLNMHQRAVTVIDASSWSILPNTSTDILHGGFTFILD